MDHFQEQPPHGDRVYLGRLENQRDPRARRPQHNAAPAPQPQRPPPQAGVRGPQKRIVPRTINRPTRLASTMGPVEPPKNEDPTRNSVFAIGMDTREVSLDTRMEPSTPSAQQIGRLTLAEMQVDDPNLQKVLLPEYMDYYTAALIWLRITSLKPKLRQPITQEERELLLIAENSVFSVPEPLTNQLKILGATQTLTREHINPQFPSLPTEQVGGFGGYYGPLSEHTHNQYEELPSLGVAAEAVRRALSNAPAGPYHSALATPELIPNENLLGFQPLGNRRLEAKNLAIACGITAERFPEYPNNTGINVEFLQSLSAVISRTNSFKLTAVSFQTLAEAGASVQTMVQRRPGPAPPLRSELDGELLTTSLTLEPVSVNGAGIMYCLQLWKDEDQRQAAHSWACVANPPQTWIDNRNARRMTLPDSYRREVFRSISQDGRNFRCLVIRQMLLTKR